MGDKDESVGQPSAPTVDIASALVATLASVASNQPSTSTIQNSSAVNPNLLGSVTHNSKLARGRQTNKKNAGAADNSSSNQYLPSTAPVSSLLPPIPHNAAQNPILIQAQLAALLHSSGAGVQSSHALPIPKPVSRFGPLDGNVQDGGALAAAAQLLAVQAAANAPVSSIGNTILPNMQNWSGDQLEQHVVMLQNMNQPVPASVNMLLNECRKREEKRQAKRLANRRSASTSRARKKALVKEMTELNARLKRQALILSLLPDLVIVIDVDAVITFCSAQVERVLGFDIDSLIGSKLTDLLAPTSREKLKKLINVLVDAERNASAGMLVTRKNSKVTELAAHEKADERQKVKRTGTGEDGVSAVSSVGVDSSGDAAVVSEPSFPLSVVDFGTHTQGPRPDENDTSDTSNVEGKTPSSLTNSACLTRSPTGSSLEQNSGSDVAGDNQHASKTKQTTLTKDIPSSDTSNTSSLSTAAKKLKKANANLERNVRWHNKKITDQVARAHVDAGYKDDVIGAAVTVNNASARLSSLQHRPGSSSEDDSGYRESNDSREETSSSSSDVSEGNGRRKPLAPTCNICLIRNDLTTIWCEVTSSLRTKDPMEDLDEDALEKPKTPPILKDSEFGTSDTSSSAPEPVKEMLLCLRPIRDGDDRVSEKYRFRPKRAGKGLVVSEESKGALSVSGPSSSEGQQNISSRPPKKRSFVDMNSSSGVPPCKSIKGDNDVHKKDGTDDDNEVVESLMLMSNNQS